MPRYESSKLGYRVPARALLHDPERYLYVSERDLSDKARLQQLFTFCGSLEQWALRFPRSTAMPSRAMIAHSAALTSDAGIEKFLDHVNQQLKSFAPFRAASSHIGERAKKEPRPLGGKSGLGRVEVLLNVLMHLSEYVVGTFEWEPSAVNTGGFPAETAEWHRCWQPPDDEVVIFMREHICELRKIERECATPMNIRKVQDRLSSLARQVVRDFTKRMTRTDEPVGFKHIKRLPGASGSPDIAKAFHDFAAAVKKIAVVVSERTGPSPYLRQWQEALLHLLEMQEMYSDKCLQLLRPRMTRVGLQKKREQLRGWIAIVAQYLFLVRGNGRCIRFAALCTGVSVATYEIRSELMKLREHSFPADRQEDIDGAAALFDQLVIDPRLSELWHSRFGEKAKQISTLVSTITTKQEADTSKIWKVRDHVEALEKAGVLTRNGIRGKKDQLQQLLYAMQEVGLAAQVPWGYISESESEEEKNLRLNSKEGLLSRRGLGWIVSPLGASLGLPPETSQQQKLKKGTPRKRTSGKRASGAAEQKKESRATKKPVKKKPR